MGTIRKNKERDKRGLLDLPVRNKRHKDCPKEANNTNENNLISHGNEIKVKELDGTPHLPVLDQNCLIIGLDSLLDLRQ